MKYFSFTIRTLLMGIGIFKQIRGQFDQAAMCFAMACYMKLSEMK